MISARGMEGVGGSLKTVKWSQRSIIRDHTNRRVYSYADFNNKLYDIHLKQLDLEAKETVGSYV
ncbi:MAG: hypothetical protein N2645_16200 [Clostridia bacterium]|nr:hypothetical protein [Clostridia bacterium]